MEGVDKLRYDIHQVEDNETEVPLVIKQTVDQGINENGVLSFRFPSDPVRFTDLNATYIKVQLKITPKDVRKSLGDEDGVFLEKGGLSSLFSSCDLRLNGELVSSMTAYPFTSSLIQYLGSAVENRSTIAASLGGSWDTTWTKSSLEGEGVEDVFYIQTMTYGGSKVVTLYCRVYSDLLTSCRQYLPPGVSLSLDFKRAPDEFSLCKIKGAGDTYRVIIESASVYMKRLRLRPDAALSVAQSVKNGAHLTFNRLETRIMSIPKSNKVWRWLDCLNGAALPNRLYVGFVAQKSLYGDLSQQSTYFEHLNLSSLNVKLNGRDVLVEPIEVKFEKDGTGQTSSYKSSATNGYFALVDVLGGLRNSLAPVRVSYYTYVGGATIFAIELGKSGEKSGSSGLVDLELTFGDQGSDMDGCVMLFTEKTEIAHVQPRVTSAI